MVRAAVRMRMGMLLLGWRWRGRPLLRPPNLGAFANLAAEGEVGLAEFECAGHIEIDLGAVRVLIAVLAGLEVGGHGGGVADLGAIAVLAAFARVVIVLAAVHEVVAASQGSGIIVAIGPATGVGGRACHGSGETIHETEIAVVEFGIGFGFGEEAFEARVSRLAQGCTRGADGNAAAARAEAVFLVVDLAAPGEGPVCFPRVVLVAAEVDAIATGTVAGGDCCNGGMRKRKGSGRHQGDIELLCWLHFDRRVSENLTEMFPNLMRLEIWKKIE